MKFCQSYGAEIHENAVICVKCGCAIPSERVIYKERNNTLLNISKIFLILSSIICFILSLFTGIFIIPFAWCLTITIMICNRIKQGKPIGIVLKICALLFVNIISGILLLCCPDGK